MSSTAPLAWQHGYVGYAEKRCPVSAKDKINYIRGYLEGFVMRRRDAAHRRPLAGHAACQPAGVRELVQLRGREARSRRQLSCVDKRIRNASSVAVVLRLSDEGRCGHPRGHGAGVRALCGLRRPGCTLLCNCSVAAVVSVGPLHVVLVVQVMLPACQCRPSPSPLHSSGCCPPSPGRLATSASRPRSLLVASQRDPRLGRWLPIPGVCSSSTARRSRTRVA